ncbi:hypothetical protein LXD69_10175 [Flavobacterium sediminilitoris]|uniref:Uncharacterized protein n=1 Tax=Flavobacterium sediminilitoris TaxID=2024526 RepID=A0ABY4HI86_9FLAO|nr:MULTISPECIES: hypothetical protein [Flavobacterium]UOX32418.1 hypothetical protein LXD69_10175 [Flavobacterium sediminilitoris]
MSTEYYGKIAISTLPSGAFAAYTFTNSNDKLDTTVTAVKVEVKDKQGEVASWGKNNDYPQQVLKAVRLNGAASSGLRFLRKAHYGNGLVLVKDEVDDNGKKKPKLVTLEEVPEIKEFFLKSQMNRFWKETIADLEYFSIAFPEYILSENFTTINRVKRQKTAWCRFEIMNEESGLVEHVYISQKFGSGSSVDLTSQYVEKVPLIDSYWSPEEVREYCKTNDIKKFIRPVFYPLLDEAFYPESEWHAVVKSGWLDVANSVPALKKAMFENQMTIKYIVEVNELYFINMYRDKWQTMKFEERDKIRQNLIDQVNDALVGNDKAGKSIQSMKVKDDKGEYHSAVTITALDDKLKNGSYLPEAEAANSEVLFALGVDPTLIGAGIPGGKLGAGSGSDKSTALNILFALFKTNRETTLESYDFIASYNGWDSSIRAGFENTILTTLDKNPTGTQNTTA